MQHVKSQLRACRRTRPSDIPICFAISRTLHSRAGLVPFGEPSSPAAASARISRRAAASLTTDCQMEEAMTTALPAATAAIEALAHSLVSDSEL